MRGPIFSGKADYIRTFIHVVRRHETPNVMGAGSGPASRTGVGSHKDLLKTLPVEWAMVKPISALPSNFNIS